MTSFVIIMLGLKKIIKIKVEKNEILDKSF